MQGRHSDKTCPLCELGGVWVGEQRGLTYTCWWKNRRRGPGRVPESYHGSDSGWGGGGSGDGEV